MTNTGQLSLKLHTQRLAVQPDGRRVWEQSMNSVQWSAAETAILISDMWDRHWSRGAIIRSAALAPAIDAFASHCRDAGVTVVHAPLRYDEFLSRSSV